VTRALVLLALVACPACAPASVFGAEARYSPEFRGYVSNGVIRVNLLVDPTDRTKIRCREALDPFLDPALRGAAARVHRLNLGFAVAVPTTIGLLPLVAPGGLLVFAGETAQSPSELLYLAVSAPSAKSLYDEGKRAYDASAWSTAEQLFERSLIRMHADGGVPQSVGRAYYYLGLLYGREGRPRDAARAFAAFVERAMVRGEAWYAEAERHLETLAPGTLAHCRSQAPVQLDWDAREGR
jgi:hypothetical protein